MKTFIDHKFEIGQKVFFLNKEHRCETGTVKYLNPNVYKDYTTLWYNLEEHLYPMREDELYASEADLKNYIFNGTLDIV